MRRIAAIFLAIVLLVFLPVIIPVVALLDRAYRKRLRAAACAFACLSCGGILGLESIRLADAQWAEHLRELREKYPSTRFRLVRHVRAICPACGVRYAFLEHERTFAQIRIDRGLSAADDVPRTLP
jgi:TRAP-type C4-dicarboxylate transport system permease small subunit